VSTYYFVGSGIAALAGAVYLIRDAGVDGRDIVLLEESADFGGALDAHGSADSGYFMSGSRMFESEYRCTFDLLAAIPSGAKPLISARDETSHVEGTIAEFHHLGLDERERADLLTLVMEPERLLDGKRITDRFTPGFFQSPFWYDWCTLFAFAPWHSAIEFRRYLLRFMHHASTIATEEDVNRAHFNPYDSIALPIVAWLKEHGTTIRFETTVVDLEFKADVSEAITVAAIVTTSGGVPATLALADSDIVFVTNGSMTADTAFGSMDAAPVLNRCKQSGAWRLWETLARGRPEFGHPAVFDDHIDESGWSSFSVTVTDPRFLERIETFTGSVPGRGGLTTFNDSNWLITIAIFHQPFFPAQPAGVDVWWGYGLYHDQPGNYVKKPMSDCTGREILEEVLGHLHFATEQAAILDSSIVIPCVMPYITSQFLVRSSGDRPRVVPAGSTNLAFIGQYAELPDEVVFTVEYSIRSAQLAVYTLLGVKKPTIPMDKGMHDPRVVFAALETAQR